MGCAGALCNGPSAALLPTAKRTQSGGSTRFHEAFPCHFQDRYVRLRSVSRKKPTPGSVRTGKPHKVSLKVLADSLELSPATVSLVMNRSAVADSIPESTKERIFAAAGKFNYRPNFFARSLRAQRSFTIGVIVPEVSDGYASLVMSGIEDLLLREGYFYFVASHRHRIDLIDEYPRLLLGRSVDGLIAVDTPWTHDDLPVPVVIISGHIERRGVVTKRERRSNRAGLRKQVVMIPIARSARGDRHRPYLPVQVDVAGDVALILRPSLIRRLPLQRLRNRTRLRERLARIHDQVGLHSESLAPGLVEVFQKQFIAGCGMDIVRQKGVSQTKRSSGSGLCHRGIHPAQVGLEDALSERVAQSIRLKLTGEETRRFTKRATERPDAYEAYIKGRYFWNKRTDRGMKKGLEYFRQAIALDPTFTEAYVGVADSYATLGLYAVIPPKEAFPAAKEATQRALEMDDGLAEAHATMGFINFYFDWNRADAENEFRRALADNPNDAMAHSWYGESLAAMGRFPEAVAEAQRALEDDPLSLIIGSNAGWTLSLAGNTDHAIEILKKAIEIDSSFPRTHFRLGRAYEQKKLYDLAISELQQAVSLSGGDACYKGSLGHAYAASGKADQARQILRDLEGRTEQAYVPSYAIALVYAGLGDNDHAITWLQKAYEDRSTSIAFLKLDPELATLHSDPRFEQLSQRVNF